MKFRDKRTGAIYEPSEAVAAMMANDPNLEPVEEQKKPRRAAKPAKTAKAEE